MDVQEEVPEDTIANFFAKSGTDATRPQCDEYAESITGKPAAAVAVQGTCSYTVVSDKDIFQFRSPKDDLVDHKLRNLIKFIHGDLVPTTYKRGTVGNVSPLIVYNMSKVPGKTHLEARLNRPIPDELSRDEQKVQHTTVTDLAKMFIAELENAQTLPLTELQSLQDSCAKKLDTLRDNLPVRFQPSVIYVRNNLDSLFTDWPMTLSHEDLTEQNVLIDPSTGHLTGVVDWVNARIAPFGVGFYGVESFMGTMNDYGWKYFCNVEKMRATFKGLIETALTESTPEIPLRVARSKLFLAEQLGVLLHYGFGFENGTSWPVTEGDENFKYLNAFVG